jgi:PAS domain S-box-containing protein
MKREYIRFNQHTAMKEGLCILNLEDNARDAELNQAMLSARWPDCHFVRVDNRTDFFAALEQSTLDLILCDYTMPGFNGREALALAREKRPEVPFLFVSGTIGEDAAIEALKNGATDYVLKHRLMRLIPAVDRALREVGDRAERKRAEEAMRQSEHKYRELFESLDDAAFLADEQSGKIIDTNRRAEALLGCSRSEILGCNQGRFLKIENPEATASEGKIMPSNGSPTTVKIHATRLMLYGRQLVLRLCHTQSPKTSAV